MVARAKCQCGGCPPADGKGSHNTSGRKTCPGDEKEKMSYKTVFEKDPSYVSWCRKHLTKDSAKGPALDWSRYIKARDLVDCKVANVPFYAGTTLRREFCD